jgi:hypothetical protein
MRFFAAFVFISMSTSLSVGLHNKEATSNVLDANSFENELMSIQFHEWIDTYHKVYTCDHAKVKRFEVWKENHGV